MNCIDIRNIVKEFKGIRALDNVSVIFEENKIYGLLGRNGAGKSTLLNIITNRIFADSGEVVADGMKAEENDDAQRKIYLMSEKNYYPDSMKVREAYKWAKEFYPDFDLKNANEIAAKFSLNTAMKIKNLSTGYVSIFKISIALSVNTPYLLLDEPVLGLDANHRELFYRILLEKYSENPCTIIISTHLIEEISGIIENIVIIDSGKIIRNESRDSLLAKGYTVTGPLSRVDDYILDKEVIGSDSLGGLKTAYIMGNLNKSEVPAELEITKLDLQKLFIKLTDS